MPGEYGRITMRQPIDLSVLKNGPKDRAPTSRFRATGRSGYEPAGAGAVNSSARRAPGTAPISLTRRDKLDWLERRKAVPLRLITAPAGFGKSRLLQAYAEGKSSVRYVHASALLESTHFLPAPDGQRSEIAIDDIDVLPRKALEALYEHALATSPDATYIFSSRTRDVVYEHRWLVDGTAALLDAAALGFSPEEIVELCLLYGMQAGDEDARELCAETDGWPMVVHAAVQFAALEALPMRGIFRAWLKSHGALLRDAIESLAAPDVFNDLSATRDSLSSDRLRNLERSGLFVLRNGDEFQVMRAVDAALSPVRDAANAGPMSIRLLGAFEIRIGDLPVEWLRRRDGQIVKYLALSPNGRASRESLARAFWPSNDRSQALQNLRTACSNIRAALRAAVGDERIEEFFESSGSDLRLNLDDCASDLAEFNRHVAEADEALSEANVEDALARLNLAHRLYRGPLIVEPPDAFYAEIAMQVEQRFGKVRVLRENLRDQHASEMRRRFNEKESLLEQNGSNADAVALESTGS